MSSYRSTKNTITTGPFLVSFNATVEHLNNRLVIIIKNPTTKPLEADIVLEYCPAPASSPTGITLPFIIIEKELPVLEGLGSTVIPPMNCARLELDITPFENAILHIKSTGDYVIGEDRPLCGKLEIEVVGGSGFSSPINPGLTFADPTLTFHYGDFVVYKRKTKVIKNTIKGRGNK